MYQPTLVKRDFQIKSIAASAFADGEQVVRFASLAHSIANSAACSALYTGIFAAKYRKVRVISPSESSHRSYFHR